MCQIGECACIFSCSCGFIDCVRLLGHLLSDGSLGFRSLHQLKMCTRTSTSTELITIKHIYCSLIVISSVRVDVNEIAV